MPVTNRILLAVASFVLFSASLWAQIPGQNINMVSGTDFPGGDPYLQRQNEPSMAVSTRNPEHLLAGANDYRSVDIPDPQSDAETHDAWLGVFTSLDGGETWRSTLLPGYPQDNSAAGKASSLLTNQAPSKMFDDLSAAGYRVWEALSVSEVLHLCEH